jgi:hypothetical protein
MREHAVLTALLLVACAGHHGPPPQVQRQASRDLGCPRADLASTRLGNDTYRIQGCGRETSYVYACAQGGCDWRRDGSPRPVRGTQPAEKIPQE